MLYHSFGSHVSVAKPVRSGIQFSKKVLKNAVYSLMFHIRRLIN